MSCKALGEMLTNAIWPKHSTTQVYSNFFQARGLGRLCVGCKARLGVILAEYYSASLSDIPWPLRFSPFTKHEDSI